ncbi:MAG: hypothetical protein AAF617_01155 [Bacteroidota bacterium]
MSSCGQKEKVSKESISQAENTIDSMSDSRQALSENLKIDHFNLWTNTPELLKQKLVEAGFTVVPDSLIQPHQGQGTRGKYINFLNMYFEIIYINNEEEFKSNQIANPLLDFETRGNYLENGASPFSIALRMKEYVVEKIPFETVAYHQSWMDEEAISIRAAKSSKTKFSEPSVFIINPGNNEEFESIEELVAKIPEQYAIWREFFKHKNGAKKVTNIQLHIQRTHEISNTIQVLNSLEDIQILDDTSQYIEIDFDNKEQDITLDFRPDFPVIFRL